MTEDEARTKICCGAPSIARSNSGEFDSRCQASACMAWRWDSKIIVDAQTLAPVPSSPITGFCGLVSNNAPVSDVR